MEVKTQPSSSVYELWFDIDESPVWIPKDLAAEEQVRMIAEAVAKQEGEG